MNCNQSSQMKWQHQCNKITNFRISFQHFKLYNLAVKTVTGINIILQTFMILFKTTHWPKNTLRNQFKICITAMTSRNYVTFSTQYVICNQSKDGVTENTVVVHILNENCGTLWIRIKCGLANIFSSGTKILTTKSRAKFWAFCPISRLKLWVPPRSLRSLRWQLGLSLKILKLS